jgi:hypothetical protein
MVKFGWRKMQVAMNVCGLKLNRMRHSIRKHKSIICYSIFYSCAARECTLLFVT